MHLIEKQSNTLEVIEKTLSENQMNTDLGSLHCSGATKYGAKTSRFCCARGQVVPLVGFSPLDVTLPNAEKVIENVELSPNPI